MDLLDKLNKIEVKASDTISQEDREFVTKLETDYLDTVKQLKNSIEILQSLVETNNKEVEDLYTIEEKNYKERFQLTKKSYHFDHETILKAYGFSFKSSILQCYNSLESAKNVFIRNVISYFNKTYSLKIDADVYSDRCKLNNWNKREVVFLEEVVEYVNSQLNGLNLKQAGIDLLIENFTSTVTYRAGWATKNKVSKNTISFPDFMYYGESYVSVDVKRLRYDDTRYWALLRAIVYFESGLTKEYCFNSKLAGFYNNMDFVFEPIEVYGEKIESVRFFKNGKVELKFTSQTHLQEFIKIFKIQF